MPSDTRTPPCWYDEMPPIPLLLTSSHPTTPSQPPYGNCNAPAWPGAPSPGNNVTTDGSCGPANGGKTCTGASFGTCCSASGYYGSTTAHCSSGCQSGFGTCSSQSGTISTDGNCGTANGKLASVWGLVAVAQQQATVVTPQTIVVRDGKFLPSPPCMNPH